MIENEELSPGDSIAPERTLCEQYDVSRMTVNKAITSLVTEGYLYREQGRGTYVAKPKKNYRVTGLSGLTEEMKERRGLKVDTEIISFEEKCPNKTIKSWLELNENEYIYKITRLRKVENEPYALEVSYIPVALCSGFNRSRLENNSLYSVLRSDYGLSLEYANQSVEPILVDEYEGKLLGLEKNTPALLFIRRTYNSEDKPFEITSSIYRCDKYKFEMTLRK
jgi:GntR family transcriptional regulator